MSTLESGGLEERPNIAVNVPWGTDPTIPHQGSDTIFNVTLANYRSFCQLQWDEALLWVIQANVYDAYINSSVIWLFKSDNYSNSLIMYF